MFVLTKDDAYFADGFTINKLGVSQEMLMENAGQAVLEKILKFIKPNGYISVFCGAGNNGGDGIVVSRRLKNLGFNVRLIFCCDYWKLKDAAGFHFELYRKHGYEYFYVDELNLDLVFLESDYIIDALFGIGFRGELNEKYKKIIAGINNSKAKIISIDIPSGVLADGDKETSCYVKANHTVTISYPKLSVFSQFYRKSYGNLIIADAGIVYKPQKGKNFKKTWGLKECRATFFKRDFSINKSTAGKALIIGGSKNMVGALLLCSRACFKSGVGLLKIVTPNDVKKFAINNIAEATYLDCKEKFGFLQDFQLDESFDVISCGPGLGRNEFTKKVVEKVILANAPIVLDADALYFLDSRLLKEISLRKFPTVLTPHSGEMGRLVCCDASVIDQNRFKISLEKAIEWNCYIVLKGPNSVLTTPSGNQYINLSGNEGLATGGTGDVLTGILTALLSSLKLDLNKNFQETISNAIFIHGKAADILVKNKVSKHGLNASNLISGLDYIFKKLNH